MASKKRHEPTNSIEIEFRDAQSIFGESIGAFVRVPDAKIYALSFGRPTRGETKEQKMANFLRDLADHIEAPKSGLWPHGASWMVD